MIIVALVTALGVTSSLVQQSAAHGFAPAVSESGPEAIAAKKGGNHGNDKGHDEEVGGAAPVVTPDRPAKEPPGQVKPVKSKPVHDDKPRGESNGASGPSAATPAPSASAPAAPAPQRSAPAAPAPQNSAPAPTPAPAAGAPAASPDRGGRRVGARSGRRDRGGVRSRNRGGGDGDRARRDSSPSAAAGSPERDARSSRRGDSPGQPARGEVAGAVERGSSGRTSPPVERSAPPAGDDERLIEPLAAIEEVTDGRVNPVLALMALIASLGALTFAIRRELRRW